jgi:hypothetical protein
MQEYRVYTTCSSSVMYARHAFLSTCTRPSCTAREGNVRQRSRRRDRGTHPASALSASARGVAAAVRRGGHVGVEDCGAAIRHTDECGNGSHTKRCLGEGVVDKRRSLARYPRAAQLILGGRDWKLALWSYATPDRLFPNWDRRRVTCIRAGFCDFCHRFCHGIRYHAPRTQRMNMNCRATEH